MAMTAPGPNNKSVNFRGRVTNEKSMRVKAPSVRKGKKPPQQIDGDRAKRAIKRGAISETAARKHLAGGY